MLRQATGINSMRIALVSPYAWTYPGGVNRHVEALAEALIARGHEVRVMAPWDPPDRVSRVLHRAPAEERRRPDYLIPLERTVGIAANGAVSNLSVFPSAVTTMRRGPRLRPPTRPRPGPARPTRRCHTSRRRRSKGSSAG